VLLTPCAPLIPLLCEVLAAAMQGDDPDEDDQLLVAETLANIAESEAVRGDVALGGGAEAVMALSKSPVVEIQREVTRALRNMATDPTAMGEAPPALLHPLVGSLAAPPMAGCASRRPGILCAVC
jgi:hypothetical protein